MQHTLGLTREASSDAAWELVDRIDGSQCPRGLCEHIASMHVDDGHCVVREAKAESGGDSPCGINMSQQKPSALSIPAGSSGAYD
jgi:hypothetical protein